jgi:hypothetical protein
VPRGAVFVSKNNEFQVSADADNPTNTGVRFSNIKGQYDDIFATFSPEKLFTPIGTNVLGIRFFVPGTNTAATVKGFGAVFTDVDRSDTTKLEFLDRDGKVIFVTFAPRALGTMRSRQLLYERADCAHWSQRSRCPPSAAVGH